jgi:DNA-binding response OmpR family regulator
MAGGEELEGNVISVYMHQLRKKPGAELLHTVRGPGYYAGPEEGGG